MTVEEKYFVEQRLIEKNPNSIQKPLTEWRKIIDVDGEVFNVAEAKKIRDNINGREMDYEARVVRVTKEVVE